MELPINSKHLLRHGKSTLSKTAYLTLQEAIINNEFKPGEILSENMLADMLKMSRTPIREALKELKSDDLVQLIPGTGIFVKELSEKELRDLFDVRIALECLAAESAVGYFDQAELENMLGEWTGLQAELKQSPEVDWRKLSKLDSQMHRMMVYKSHNDCLIQLYATLLPKLSRYQTLSVQSWGRAENTVEQHIEILAAVKNKDTARLIELLRKHLQAGLDIILKKSRSITDVMPIHLKQLRKISEISEN